MTEHNEITTLNFEEAYAQLQRIVAQIEGGDLSLDDSVTLYARGQALARHCSALLDNAELRVQQITDESASSVQQSLL